MRSEYPTDDETVTIGFSSALIQNAVARGAPPPPVTKPNLLASVMNKSLECGVVVRSHCSGSQRHTVQREGRCLPSRTVTGKFTFTPTVTPAATLSATATVTATPTRSTESVTPPGKATPITETAAPSTTPTATLRPSLSRSGATLTRSTESVTPYGSATVTETAAPSATRNCPKLCCEAGICMVHGVAQKPVFGFRLVLKRSKGQWGD